VRDPLLRVLHDIPSRDAHFWLTRVCENFRQLLAPTGLSPSSANGAPIHLLKWNRTGKAGQAQTVSLLTHAGVILAIVFFAVRPPTPKLLTGPIIRMDQGQLVYTPPSEIAVSNPSPGRRGGAGENNPVPTTHGFLAPHSSIQLAAPRLPDNPNHQLPVPVTILDTKAPPVPTPVTELGLPWMSEDTNSAGPGRDHGFGTGGKSGMGDREGQDAGFGESDRPYKDGFTMPTCSFCPLPIYSDEARHVKMQGTVTLRVLVGTDGRASDIRVVRGVGYGLEERAVETVRSWKFSPARDASQRVVAAWVTIEAVFRLF
jgi:periplasmic protein TonB